MEGWTDEWPTEEGYYWFYGVRTSYVDKKQLMHVRVFCAGPADRRFINYVADGAFLYKSEGGSGFWHADIPPELPIAAMARKPNE